MLAGAWAIAPHLPGADAEPLFDTHNDRGGVTEIVSPLVDIRSAHRQPGRAPRCSRCRPTPRRTGGSSALPRFDGDTWDVARVDPRRRRRRRPRAAAPAARSRTTRCVTIDGLDGALVPAAPEPVSARWARTATTRRLGVAVKTDSTLDDGDMFEIVSAMPRFDADALRAATSDAPPDDIFLELPDDLPPVIAETATDGHGRRADELRPDGDAAGLVPRRRSRYDTDVPDGHGSSAIVSFLENKVGYCEQFAGTFAAMARTLGIPARVAVGFTQGEQAADGTYEVLGRNAHAWPEVWFDGYGWVPFEPTPGRGHARRRGVHRHPPQQDTGERPTTTTTTTTTLPTTTTLAGQTPPPPQPDDARRSAAGRPRRRRPTSSDASTSGSRGCCVLAIVVLVALLVALLPELVRRWRRRRHGPITDPAHVLARAVGPGAARARRDGVPRRPAQTPIEVSDRAARRSPASPRRSTSSPWWPPRRRTRRAAEVARLADDRHPSYNGPHDWCAPIEAPSKTPRLRRRA